MVLEYCRESQQVWSIYGRMGRAPAQQVLKYGSWSLPTFVGCNCVESSEQFRGDFKPFRSDFDDFWRFWAILSRFDVVLSAFQVLSGTPQHANGVRARGGSRDGPASPASMGIFIGMDEPQQVWCQYIPSFDRALGDTQTQVA